MIERGRSNMEKFQVVVAGGRDFSNYPLLCKKLDHLFQNRQPTAIISGLARGADTLGRQYALERDIQVLEFPAHWNELGKRAGMVRNREMLEAADAVVVFWDSVSKGTANMVEITQKAGLPLRIVRY